jgi:hypothetical protein
MSAGDGATATKLILLDSLLQEVVATLPHLVFQILSRGHGCKNGEMSY